MELFSFGYLFYFFKKNISVNQPYSCINLTSESLQNVAGSRFTCAPKAKGEFTASELLVFVIPASKARRESFRRAEERFRPILSLIKFWPE